MSRERLTEALLDKSSAQARELWQGVEQEADRYRQEAEELCAERRRAADHRHEMTLQRQRDRLDNRVGKRLRRVRLHAEETFSEQLWQLAMEQLEKLSKDDRAAALQLLATELPGRDWQQVTVHPDDQELAAQLFPGCAVMTDPALQGGVLAATADGVISVDNSLLRRLIQVWPELCGSLLDELQKKQGTADDEPAA